MSDLTKKFLEEMSELFIRERERDAEARGAVNEKESIARRMLSAGKYTMDEIASLAGLSSARLQQLAAEA